MFKDSQSNLAPCRSAQGRCGSVGSPYSEEDPISIFNLRSPMHAIKQLRQRERAANYRCTSPALRAPEASIHFSFSLTHRWLTEEITKHGPAWNLGAAFVQPTRTRICAGPETVIVYAPYGPLKLNTHTVSAHFFFSNSTSSAAPWETRLYRPLHLRQEVRIRLGWTRGS
jgi:hypothetical protein